MAYDAASSTVNVVSGPPRVSTQTELSAGALQLVRLTSPLSFEHTDQVANGPFLQ
jgi:hypothetical protein